MGLNRNILSVFFSVFIVILTYGQLDEKEQDSILQQNLDEVVVTATRTIRQLSSLPLPVTLIPKTQIERSGVTRLNEILNEQTGIIMTPDINIGGGLGVQIQGIEADYIMILVDGVPIVGRSGGNLDLSRLAIGNIQQIEVVKGPSSALFGSEALGGVVNIITERPKTEKITGQISHRAGTFNNQNSTLSLGQRKGKLGYSIFLDRLSTDGFDLAPDAIGQTTNPFFNYTFNGRVFYDASDALNFFASGRYFLQDFDVSSGTSEERDSNVQLKIDHKLSKKSRFEYELYYTNYITNEQSVDPINDEILLDNDFDQKLLRPEIRYNLNFKDSNTLTMGGGYNFETLDRSLFANQVSFDSQYVFAQFDFTPIKKLNVIVGARFDNHSEYNSQFSPKISARYEILDGFAMKASVGSGFKAPDFRQLYLDFTNALGGGYSVFGKEVELQGIQRLIDNDEITRDPDGNLLLRFPLEELGEPLNAESSIGYNLGFDYKKGTFRGNINFFRNDITDQIDTEILATKTSGANVFGYVNRSRVYTQGLEVDLKYSPLKNLNLSAGYQLLYAFDKDIEEQLEENGAFARNPETLETIRINTDDYFGLINRSRHTLNVKTFYEVPKWDANANLRVIYRSRFGLTDINGNGFLDNFDNSFVDGYALVNLSFGKRFFKNYQVQIGANNLFDFRGIMPEPFRPLDTAGNRTTVFVDPGIQLFGRLNIDF